jgi:thiol-disulfide isomerase/thioredoxin
LAHGLTTQKESRRPLVFFLDNDAMNITLDESNKQLVVKGSQVNDIYMANAPIVRSKGYNLDSLLSVHSASPATPYFIVKDFAYKLNLEEMKSVRAKLDASLDGTSYVKQIESMIARMEKVQIGSEAPDFTLPDVDGNPVSLSSFRGKYVLVDFWASWCGPCRRLMPVLKELYTSYHPSGKLEILGVSCDKDEAAWLQAIEEDELPWLHIRDQRTEEYNPCDKYGISAIPTTILINREGVIVARNPSEAEIEEILIAE